MNLGQILVNERIELNRQWMRVHCWLYAQGTPIIPDELYNSRYEHYAIEEGYVGSEHNKPDTPLFATCKEEAKWSGLPEWDHIHQYRTRRNNDNLPETD